jgi:hypothetical protein
MSKFKVGDRVAVYGYFGRIKGKVDYIEYTISGRYLYVIEDGFYSCHDDGPFHIKQCRKRVKKKKNKLLTLVDSSS